MTMGERGSFWCVTQTRRNFGWTLFGWTLYLFRSGVSTFTYSLHLTMYFLLNMGIFQCHVSFQGCTLILLRCLVVAKKHVANQGWSWFAVACFPFWPWWWRVFCNVPTFSNISSQQHLSFCYITHRLSVRIPAARRDEFFFANKNQDYKKSLYIPGIPTTIKTMGVNITTIVYLRVLIIQIGSTIILMVVEAQGIFQGTIGCSPNNVSMVFIGFSRDSWGLWPINTHYIGLI